MIKLEEYIKKPLEERQAHLNLKEDCIERGTTSTTCRGLLAYYLDTTTNTGCKPWVDLCHACNNPKCSNPKHLYWGTRSENMNDLVKTGFKFKGNKGEKHYYYKVKPWNNPMNIIGYDTGKSWLKAELIYKELVLNDWNFSKYGQGYNYLIKHYNIVQGVARTMIKMFKEGWNPLTDEDYQKFLNNFNK